MTGKFFFSGGGGVKFWSKDLSGFCLKPLGFDFCPHSIIPVDHSCHLNWGQGQFVRGRVGGVSVEIPVGWWKRDSPAFGSSEVGISDSALANHPTQFLPLLESIGFPPFKASRLGFTLLQLQRDITLTISQLPQLLYFSPALPVPDILLASPPSRASRGSAVHVFLVTPVKYLVALKKPVLTWLIIKVHNLTLAY